MIAATLKRPALATIGGAPGLLLSVSETAQGALYRKWIGVFGATRASVAILATFPEALAEELSEPLKRNVVSAR